MARTWNSVICVATFVWCSVSVVEVTSQVIPPPTTTLSMLLTNSNLTVTDTAASQNTTAANTTLAPVTTTPRPTPPPTPPPTPSTDAPTTSSSSPPTTTANCGSNNGGGSSGISGAGVAVGMVIMLGVVLLVAALLVVLLWRRGWVLPCRQENSSSQVNTTLKKESPAVALATVNENGDKQQAPKAVNPPTPKAVKPPTPKAVNPPTPKAVKPPTPKAVNPPTPKAVNPPTPKALKPPEHRPHSTPQATSQLKDTQPAYVNTEHPKLYSPLIINPSKEAREYEPLNVRDKAAEGGQRTSQQSSSHQECQPGDTGENISKESHKIYENYRPDSSTPTQEGKQGRTLHTNNKPHGDVAAANSLDPEECYLEMNDPPASVYMNTKVSSS